MSEASIEAAEVEQPAQEQLPSAKPESRFKIWLRKLARSRKRNLLPISGGSQQIGEQISEEDGAAEAEPEADTLNKPKDWEFVKNDIGKLAEKVAEEQQHDQEVNKQLEQKAAEANERRNKKTPPASKKQASVRKPAA